MIKFKLNKKMGENLTDVQLQLYYKEKLGRKEKSRFLKYLMDTFDYSYQSIQQKLTGRCGLNKRDIILIGHVVEKELWRQKSSIS